MAGTRTSVDSAAVSSSRPEFGFFSKRGLPGVHRSQGDWLRDDEVYFLLFLELPIYRQVRRHSTTSVTRSQRLVMLPRRYLNSHRGFSNSLYQIQASTILDHLRILASNDHCLSHESVYHVISASKDVPRH